MGDEMTQPPRMDVTSVTIGAPDPRALALWRGAHPITDDSLPGRFLRSRGIAIAIPPSLRAGGCAMIAALQAPDGRVIAVQQTMIDSRGDRKAQVRVPRRTIGALGYGAVRLAPAQSILGLAEGTEKALAAMQLFGLPCWASLGAGRMQRVWIPDYVIEINMFRDNDDAGKTAAERTAYAHRHRKVVLRCPPAPFKDWDDVTQSMACP